MPKYPNRELGNATQENPAAESGQPQNPPVQEASPDLNKYQKKVPDTFSF